MHPVLRHLVAIKHAIKTVPLRKSKGNHHTAGIQELHAKTISIIRPQINVHQKEIIRKENE